MDTSDQYLNCLCRTCMNEVETSSNGANTTPQQQWQSIFDRIEECGALKIAELLSQAVPQMEMELSDELPKKICVKCLQQLLSAYRFSQMCIQSEERLREMVSKRLTDLKISTIKAVMERELGTNDTDSYPLINFLSSTLENLQHPSIQDPLREAIEQVIESETAQSSGAEHLDNIEKLLEACKDAQNNFNEFNKNERIEEGRSDIEYSDGGTIHSTISVTNDQLLPIDSEEQQENVIHKKLHGNTKREACDICGKIVSKVCLKKHKLIHTGEKPHKCDVCEKRFIRTQELRYHMRTHTGEKPYKCKYCDSRYTRKSHLVRHLRSHGNNVHKNDNLKAREGNMKESKLRLQNCQQPPTEGSPQQLEIEVKDTLENLQHPSIQDPLLEAIEQVIESEAAQSSGAEHLDNIEKLLEACKDAQDNFNEVNKNERIEEGGSDIEYSDGGTVHSTISVTNDDLLAIDSEEQEENVMNNSHDEDMSYECSYCPKRFHSTGNLLRHKKLHGSTKRETCDICDKKFVRKADLRNHKLVHTGEKPHKCDVCEKRFIRRQQLRYHMYTHTGEKPFKCKYCESRYYRKSHLVRHLRSHLGNNVHRCELCPLDFRLGTELSLHLNSHKNDDVKTRERNMKDLRKKESKLRLQNCQQPSAEGSPEQLEIHVKENVKEHCLGHDEERPYECPYCLQRYRSKKSMIRHKKQTHESTKQEACDICGKKFLRKWDLKVHKRIHADNRP